MTSTVDQVTTSMAQGTYSPAPTNLIQQPVITDSIGINQAQAQYVTLPTIESLSGTSAQQDSSSTPNTGSTQVIGEVLKAITPSSCNSVNNLLSDVSNAQNVINIQLQVFQQGVGLTQTSSLEEATAGLATGSFTDLPSTLAQQPVVTP